MCLWSTGIRCRTVCYDAWGKSSLNIAGHLLCRYTAQRPARGSYRIGVHRAVASIMGCTVAGARSQQPQLHHHGDCGGGRRQQSLPGTEQWQTGGASLCCVSSWRQLPACAYCYKGRQPQGARAGTGAGVSVYSCPSLLPSGLQASMNATPQCGHHHINGRNPRGLTRSSARTLSSALFAFIRSGLIA